MSKYVKCKFYQGREKGFMGAAYTYINTAEAKADDNFVVFTGKRGKALVQIVEHTDSCPNFVEAQPMQDAVAFKDFNTAYRVYKGE